MHLFFSAGEPSGDLHAANLAEAIRACSPNPKQLRFVGLGGPKMAAAGVTLQYPLTTLAVMWFGRAMLHLPTFFRIARQADIYFRQHKPDAVIVTDYPGFHWALAKRARRNGIPVYYFVPPQLWAWAGWRVEKVRRYFTAVLTALPFEEAWYQSRGIRTHHVGHPYFDELSEQSVDDVFVADQTSRAGPLVTLLPGSRMQEVTANGPLMLAAAARVHAAIPTTRFAIAAFSEKHAALMRTFAEQAPFPVEIHVGRTPELIAAATSCIAVSGSVGLELLVRLKPSVVIYRISPFARFVSRQFIICKYISIVNLIAESELFPEFLMTRDDPARIAEPIIHWLQNPANYAETVAKLRSLRDHVAVPGACQRAAEFLLADIPGHRP